MAQILLPAIDCVDDPAALRIVADMVEEDSQWHTQPRLPELLRLTATIWEYGWYLRRSSLSVGLPVWARLNKLRWDRADVFTIGRVHVVVGFHRFYPGLSRRRRIAWWDLKKVESSFARVSPNQPREMSVSANAALAAGIMRAAIAARRPAEVRRADPQAARLS